MTSQIPFVPTPSPEQSATPAIDTKSPEQEDADETAHFDAAKTKALADPHVQALQAKADTATGDDAKPALKRYYRALYGKMEEIDPSVKERIDRAEAATLKRVDAETE